MGVVRWEKMLHEFVSMENVVSGKVGDVLPSDFDSEMSVLLALLRD